MVVESIDHHCGDDLVSIYQRKSLAHSIRSPTAMSLQATGFETIWENRARSFSDVRFCSKIRCILSVSAAIYLLVSGKS